MGWGNFDFLYSSFLIGFFRPFLFIKSVSKWRKWIPAIIFFIATILLGIVSLYFPGPGEFDDLIALLYAEAFGIGTIGAILGGLYVNYKRGKK